MTPLRLAKLRMMCGVIAGFLLFCAMAATGFARQDNQPGRLQPIASPQQATANQQTYSDPQTGSFQQTNSNQHLNSYRANPNQQLRPRGLQPIQQSQSNVAMPMEYGDEEYSGTEYSGTEYSGTEYSGTEYRSPENASAEDQFTLNPLMPAQPKRLLPLFDQPQLSPVFDERDSVRIEVMHESELRELVRNPQYTSPAQPKRWEPIAGAQPLTDAAAVISPATHLANSGQPANRPDSNGGDINREVAERGETANLYAHDPTTDGQATHDDTTHGDTTHGDTTHGDTTHDHATHDHSAFNNVDHNNGFDEITYDAAVAPVSYDEPQGIATPQIGKFNFQSENTIRPAVEIHASADDEDVQFVYLPMLGQIIPIETHHDHDDVPDGPHEHGVADKKEIQGEIDEHKEELVADLQIDEATRAEKMAMLTAASAELHKHDTYEGKLLKFQNELITFPEELKKYEAELAANPVPRALQVGGDEIPAVKLQLRKEKLEEEQNTLNNIQLEIDGQRARITQIPEIRSTIRTQLQEVETNLAKTKHDDHEMVYKWILLSAQRLSLNSRSKMLAVEVQWQELAGKVLPMKRDVYHRRVRLTGQEVANWEREIADLRRQEIQKQADEARAQALDAHPALKSIAVRNQELTQSRIEVTELIRAAEQEKATVQARIKDFETRRKTMTSRIETAGVTVANGALLLENRRVVLPPFESRARIREINSELQSVNMELLRIEEERKPLADIREFVEDLLSNTHGSSLTRDDLAAMAQKTAETKRQYLDDLRSDFDMYRGLLSEMATYRQTLVTEINDTRSFIDEHALWIRSTDTISVSDLRPAAEGLKAFFAPAEWRSLSDELIDSLLHKPQRTALWVVSLLGLVLFTRSIRPQTLSENQTITPRSRKVARETAEAVGQYRDTDSE